MDNERGYRFNIPSQSSQKKSIGKEEKENLERGLRDRLISCGWTDEIDGLASEYMGANKDVSLDELIQFVTRRGRVLVPNDVKAELLQQIRAKLAPER